MLMLQNISDLKIYEVYTFVPYYSVHIHWCKGIAAFKHFVYFIASVVHDVHTVEYHSLTYIVLVYYPTFSHDSIYFDVIHLAFTKQCFWWIGKIKLSRLQLLLEVV